MTAKKDKKDVSVLERRMCRVCKKYHSKSKIKTVYERECRMKDSHEHVEEEEQREEEEEEQMMECDAVPECAGRNIFESLHAVFGK